MSPIAYAQHGGPLLLEIHLHILELGALLSQDQAFTFG